MTSPVYCLHIMASQKNGTTYIGVTNDIVMRSTQHMEGRGSISNIGNRVDRLVYYEEYADIREFPRIRRRRVQRASVAPSVLEPAEGPYAER